MVRVTFASLVALFWINATAASAQVPAAGDLGRIEERFRPEQTPRSQPPTALSLPLESEAVAHVDETTFTLRGVNVDGSTVFSSQELEAFYVGHIGDDVSFLDVYAIRDAITAQYRAEGYVLSRAIIPPQEISDGEVRIQVVEGFVSHAAIEGDVGERSQLIHRIAESITRSQPTRLADLERSVLLIDDLPGVEVNTVLRPSADTPGGADLIIATDQTRFSGFVSADNRGSLAIGPEQFSAGLQVNSLAGLMGQTSVYLATTAQTRELRYISVQHDQPLNAEGLRLSMSGSVSRSRSGGAISILDPFGNGETYRVGLSQPLIRTRSTSLTLEGELTYLNSTTDLLGVPYSEDRIRYLSFGASYDFGDLWFGDRYPASTLVFASVSRGLDIFNATPTGSPDLTRANGQSDFTRFNWELTRFQNVTPNFSLVLSIAAQFAADPLLSSQQFGLGGARYGRGYEPSELTGDHGAAVSLEGRYSLARPVFGSATQLYVYYDVGRVWLTEPLAGEPDHHSLASAGVGARFQVTSAISAEFELARPLTRDIASRGDRDIRPLFSISTRF